MSVSRISRALVHAAVALGVLNLSGCYTTRSVTVYQNPLPDSLYVYSQLSEDPVWIHYPTLQGDEVVGYYLTRTDSVEVRVPATQDVQEIDAGKTSLLAAAGAAVIFVLLQLVGEGVVPETGPGF
jgi:hypothetical protein